MFQRENIQVVMMSQGASKTNISLVVQGERGQEAVRLLHKEFFDAPSVCSTPQGITVGLPSNGNGAHN
jgi:aspartate kinase